MSRPTAELRTLAGAGGGQQIDRQKKQENKETRDHGTHHDFPPQQTVSIGTARPYKS